MEQILARLASIDQRLTHIEERLTKQEASIEQRRKETLEVDFRDRETSTRIVGALENVAKQLGELADRIDKQNSRVKKLELWRAEMHARTGIISAIVAMMITVALTIGEWIMKFKS